jgi:hypothetical protein
VARYRTKDQTDLAWNRIRRRLTQELDIEIRNRREEILNEVLTKAWDEYARAIGEGKVPEVEGRYSKMAVAIVQDALPASDEIVGEPDAEVE